MKNIIVVLAAVALFASCKKETVTPSEYDSSKKAALSIEFDNIVGAADLELNTGNYTNQSGETFKVSKLKYYVSNFKLTNINGTEYIVPQDSCYFLIDEEDESTHEPVLRIPEGEYKTLTFTLGVDSLRNTKDISQRTGVLDPTGTGADMYWSWNSGYIFFKMEGTSPASMMGDYAYHIGFFGGMSTPTINNIKTVSLDLTARGTPKIKSGKETNVHLMLDILKVFNGSTNFSIADHSMVMFEPFTSTVANNYATMIKHDHTEN
ncbi:MAG: MbnP family protein [Bacteroidota bacterium]